jgi:dephospho-CoA kinase
MIPSGVFSKNRDAPAGLSKLLTPVATWATVERLVQGWARGDFNDRMEVVALLHKAGLDEDAIAAQTLAVDIDVFERLDRLIAQAEARRNAVLREIDRRRETVARRLREVAQMIEDAEFTEVDPALGEG